MKAIDLFPPEPANGYKNRPSNLVHCRYLHQRLKESAIAFCSFCKGIKAILTAGAKNVSDLFEYDQIMLLLTPWRRCFPEPQNMALRHPVLVKCRVFCRQAMHVFFFWFARRRWPLFGETVCTWGQTLLTVMKEPVHWEVMPGLCFSLHLAHCHSICSHLAYHQAQMKTSKWYLQSEVIVFFF